MLKDGMFVGMALEEVKAVLDEMGLTYQEIWDEDDLENSAEYGLLVDTYEILFDYESDDWDADLICVQCED